MRQISVHRYMLLLAVIFLIAGCAQTPFQLKNDSAETLSQPDCSKHYSKEMGFVDGWEYKTWVKYNDMDFRKAFEAAESSTKKMGYRVVRSDRDSGRITAEKSIEGRSQTVYAMNVKIEKEERTLIVSLSTKAPRGTIDSSNLCSFYEEFEKAKSKKLTEPPPGAVPAPLERTKEASQPTGSSKTTASKLDPSSSATPSPPSAPKRTAQVKWSSVNLREGPGMNFKVVGSITKGTSLLILEEKGEWFHIRFGEGKEAWIYKSALSEDGPKSQSQASSPAQKTKPAKVTSPM